MKGLQAMLLADFYKLSHRVQYPSGTEVVYSTWTPRASKIPGINEVVCFGIQGFVKEWLIDFFNEHFFDKPLHEVVLEYRRVIIGTLGAQNPDTSHIEELWHLGYLPLEIKAVPEGTKVPIRCPMMTIQNTDTRFFWLTNFVETLMSCNLWQPMTSATIANKYRELLDEWATKTGGDMGFVPFQAHDFSMRGMAGVEAAARSGAGHLLSFTGTDTIPAITYREAYYGADVTKELVGTSIPATEHSVMCAYGDDSVSFKRLLTEIYPNGLVSVVSDTWDLWDVLTRILPRYKNDVLRRAGKLVIRPDSGDPVKIICGDKEVGKEYDAKDTAKYDGVVETLWKLFGGTVNDKGYRVLDSHIGVIYGDSITLDRARQICEGLERKGFASTNVVYGVGSYTYQYTTRDTFGFALKSTLVQIDGQEKQIFKNPVTDDGTKKSQRGGVFVHSDMTWSDGHGLVLGFTEPNLLQPVFRNGQLLKEQTLAEIRARLRG